MSFYDRYLTLCKDHGLQPHSQRAAELFGVTRDTLSTWRKGGMPRSDTLILIANHFKVSVDYLICRTDDPTDYTLGTPSPVPAQTPTLTPPQAPPRILALWQQLDQMDQIRVEAYVEGMLVSDKYRIQNAKKTG